MNIEQIRSLPKIELHCHLDGSLSPELVQRLLANRGEDTTIAELRERLCAPQRCADLAEYLQRFDLPNRVLQTREELREAAYDLAKRAALEQVRYLECRFAPTFSTAEGLSVTEVLASVAEGFAKADTDYGITAGILVCGMRGLSEESNLSMLREAMATSTQSSVRPNCSQSSSHAITSARMGRSSAAARRRTCSIIFPEKSQARA